MSSFFFFKQKTANEMLISDWSSDVCSSALAFRDTLAARPEPGSGAVLVRIAASGVNPLDLKIRAGSASHAAHPLPNILGIDMAGTVEAVGPGVTGWRAGDAVYGMTGDRKSTRLNSSH